MLDSKVMVTPDRGHQVREMKSVTRHNHATSHKEHSYRDNRYKHHSHLEAHTGSNSVAL
jgi:hypothetical protein